MFERLTVADMVEYVICACSAGVDCFVKLSSAVAAFPLKEEE